MARENAVFYMDVLLVRYAKDGITPIACEMLIVKTPNGTESEAYSEGKKWLKTKRWLSANWRVNSVGYPDTLNERYQQMRQKCRANSIANAIRGKE